MNGRKKAKLVTIMVEGIEITAMIDSRASIVVTKHMGRDEEKEDKVYLFQSYRQMSVYMGMKSQCIFWGPFRLKRKRKRKKTRLLLSVLGRETSETLGVLRVGLPSDVGSLSEKPECNEKYKSLYSGLGKLKGKRSLCM